MTRYDMYIFALLAMSARSCSAFAPAPTRGFSTSLRATNDKNSPTSENVPYFLDVSEPVPDNVKLEKRPVLEPEKTVMKSTSPTSPKKSLPKKKPKGGAPHKEGVLSPVVQLANYVLGDEDLNKLRAKVISMHSEVIGSFVDTSDTAFGQAVLRKLFDLSDKDGDGKIDKEELKAAFDALGFSWLKEKQVDGILKRADSDDDGVIEVEEWYAEAPKTLRTNLVKLAKKNGGELGLLV